MKKTSYALFAIAGLAFAACQPPAEKEILWQQMKVDYPTTAKVDTVDTYWNKEIQENQKMKQNEVMATCIIWFILCQFQFGHF